MNNSTSSFEPTFECREYIKSVLLSGLALSQKVASKVDLSFGRVFACPELKGPGEARFSFGGVGSWTVARDQLVTRVAEFLQTPNRAAIFENVLARPGDPWLTGKETHFVFVGNEVYYPVESSEAQDAVHSAIRNTMSANGLFCVLCDLPESQPLVTARGILTAGNLDILLMGLQGFIIGAFDGEGWLWWHKRDGNQ
jgi:hypothetical protein